MSRYGKQNSYGHRIKALGGGYYRLSWSYDFYIKGSMLRFCKTVQRETDEAGAMCFAKRWDCKMPSAPLYNHGMVTCYPHA